MNARTHLSPRGGSLLVVLGVPEGDTHVGRQILDERLVDLGEALVAIAVLVDNL